MVLHSPCKLLLGVPLPLPLLLLLLLLPLLPLPLLLLLWLPNPQACHLQRSRPPWQHISRH
jgi:hypothetical protein